LGYPVCVSNPYLRPRVKNPYCSFHYLQCTLNSFVYLRHFVVCSSILIFWLWGWDWRLTGLRPLLQAFCRSPGEDEWRGEWMNYFFGFSEKWSPTVEWYWQGKIEELGEKPVPVPLCPPQIPLDWPGREPRRLTWAMARPCSSVTSRRYCVACKRVWYANPCYWNIPRVFLATCRILSCKLDVYCLGHPTSRK
jgi:hypothetical protein